MTPQEEYIRKILEIGANVDKYNNLIIVSYSNIDTAKEMFLKLKDEYKIDQMIFLDYDHEKLYNFLKTNPSKEEVIDILPKMPKLKDREKTKIIVNYPSNYDGYSGKLQKEFKEPYKFYREQDKKFNEEYYSLKEERNHYMITAIPDKVWANHLLGSPDKEDELWELVNKTVPNIDVYKDYIEHKKEINEFLQNSKIKNLTLYTNLGTDFRVSLTHRSLWLSEPESNGIIDYYFNFPSYEIFTAPDCYSGEGKIVLARPNMFYGHKINNAVFTFNKGKCIDVECDSDYANGVIKNDINKLNYIGEIALVSNDSPIAKLGKNLDCVLLDENAGCHFALGYAITDSIDVDKSILESKGKRRYHFNDSKYHHDFVFGNDSVTVEADLGHNKKVLLLENGTWKI